MRRLLFGRSTAFVLALFAASAVRADSVATKTRTVTKLADGVWTLARERPDFSPFDFAQRYDGRFTEDGSAIVGRWEIRHEVEEWRKDFDITYRRLG